MDKLGSEYIAAQKRRRAQVAEHVAALKALGKDASASEANLVELDKLIGQLETDES